MFCMAVILPILNPFSFHGGNPCRKLLCTRIVGTFQGPSSHTNAPGTSGLVSKLVAAWYYQTLAFAW
jgi:hypothetical protein